MTNRQQRREQLATTVSEALKSLPEVLAGWEGGSAAFDLVDEYSDIDLTFLVADHAALDALYASAEKALTTISPIVASHVAGVGRYYRLRDCGDLLLVDLIFLRAGDPDHYLEAERHGHARPLFDKAAWLVPRALDEARLRAKQDERLRDLQTWFLISQGFVLKAIRRGREIEALNAFWGYTLGPLVELLRMRYCPVRWDFAMRYLERDLPPTVYERIRDLVFVRDFSTLEAKLATASAWGNELLREMSTGKE